MILLLQPNTTIKNTSSYQQQNAPRAFGMSKSLKSDVFIKTSVSFGSKSPKEEIESYIDAIEKGAVKESSAGWQAKFYKMNDIVGIKAPAPKNNGYDVCGKNNICEFSILQHLNKRIPNVATTPVDLIERINPSDNEPKYYLAMEIVKGEPLNPNKITKENLADITKNLFSLQKEGVHHFDLQNENIFLESPTKSRIIDFGSYSMIDNQGNVDFSESIGMLENPKEVIFNNPIDAAPEQKWARHFLKNEKSIFITAQDSNPYLNFHCNVSNFEHRAMHNVLISKAQENPAEAKTLFSDYLKLKATNFHAQMKEFLSSIDIDNFTKPDDDSLNIQRAKTNLQKAIRHEEVSSIILKNPSDNIIKTELAKMQLRTYSSFDSQSLSKDELKALHRAFVAQTKEFAKTATPEEKEYYEGSLSSLDFAKEDARFFTGDTKKISDNKNILKLLFSPIENLPQSIKPTSVSGAEATSESVKTAPKSNKKLYAIIAGAFALAGIGGYFLHEKSSETKKK